MSTTDTKRETRISDTHLAAFLHASNHELLRIEGPSTRRTFIFANVEQDTVVAYYSDKAACPPRRLLNSLRDLRMAVNQEF